MPGYFICGAVVIAVLVIGYIVLMGVPNFSIAEYSKTMDRGRLRQLFIEVVIYLAMAIMAGFVGWKVLAPLVQPFYGEVTEEAIEEAHEE